MDTVGEMMKVLCAARALKHFYCVVPNSRICVEILNVLVALGYIDYYDARNECQVTVYFGKQKIRSIRRISTSGNRVYVTRSDLENNKTPGWFILLTSFGVITDVEACALNVGGEVLLHVW